MWALVPESVSSVVSIDSCADILKERKGTDTRSMDKLSPDNDLESDDSMSEFERNLRELLSDLNGGHESATAGQPIGTRKSKRLKKPSSWFNEEAG